MATSPRVIEGYGVATEGPIPPDSPLHDRYLIQTFPDPFITTRADCRAAFDELFRGHMCYPWYDPLRVVQFIWLIDIANRLNTGASIEVGTASGEAARCIWRLMRQECHLYCFDTFEGFDPREVERENVMFHQNVDKKLMSGYGMETVRQRITGGQGDENLSLVKGWFPGSFNGYEHLRFRFAHIDVDLYDPTRAALELIWPRMVPGGAMLFHDYGCSLFPGVRKAVDEFFSRIGITPLPLYDKLVSAVVIKPQRTWASNISDFVARARTSRGKRAPHSDAS